MKVLVIDDSAVVRQVMTFALTRSGMEVVSASDPIFAMGKLQNFRPDVILLDIEMPRMDGITFLQRQMATDPIPTVICSSLAGRGTEVALRALQEGAVAVIEKPNMTLKDSLERLADSLVETVTEASKARFKTIPKGIPPKGASASSNSSSALPFSKTTDKVIAIGASLGGTEAVRFILESLPVDVPGLVIVQHMTAAFISAFSKQLNGSCKLEVKEAVDGDRIIRGRALIAPGDRHTMIRRSGGHYVVEVSDGQPVCRHRPSADLLFQSAATAAGANAVGVILTGMGEDGADGLSQMRAKGAQTLAQDEASSAVFGMAKEAIRRGAVQETNVLPLEQIPAALLAAMADQNQYHPELLQRSSRNMVTAL